VLPKSPRSHVDCDAQKAPDTTLPPLRLASQSSLVPVFRRARVCLTFSLAVARYREIHATAGEGRKVLLLAGQAIVASHIGPANSNGVRSSKGMKCEENVGIELPSQRQLAVVG